MSKKTLRNVRIKLQILRCIIPVVFVYVQEGRKLSKSKHNCICFVFFIIRSNNKENKIYTVCFLLLHRALLNLYVVHS